MTKTFAGVPAGRVEMTALPNVLFSELLPEIDDLAEWQVTLHIFYLLSHKKGSPRFVTRDELRADATLCRALARSGQPVEKILARALQQAETRGTLLHLERENVDCYFFNTAESRQALERIARGELWPEKNIRQIVPATAEPPNIFKLYEQNIGVLTPLIAEELKEAAQEYPPEIIADAFRIATENNVRKWTYVRKILLNWAREGQHETSKRDSGKKRQPYFQGKYSDRNKH